MPKQSMPYSLRRHEAVGPGLIRILNAMAKSARDLAAQPESQLPDSIHDLRTLIKRFRAYLWFFRPSLGKVRYTHSKVVLRKAAHRLGQARDLHAIQSALIKAASPEAHEKHLQALVRVSQAFAQHEASRQKFDGDSRGPLQKTAAVVVQVVEKTIRAAKRTDRKWPSPKHRVKKAFQLARKVRKKALRKNELPLVHEWRKKTKKLLYVLQLTVGFPTLEMSHCLEKVDKLQEILGDFQDGVVAENHLRAHLSDVDAADLARALHLLKKKRKILLKEAQRCWGSMIRQL